MPRRPPRRLLPLAAVLLLGCSTASGAVAPSSAAAERQWREVLAAAAEVGLDPADYAGPDLEADLRRYVEDLHFGRIDPAEASHGLRIDRSRLDVEATVRSLREATDVRRELAALEPTFIHYRLLKAELARYRILAADRSLQSLPPMPPGKRVIGVGDRWTGVPALTGLLRAVGDWTSEAPGTDHLLFTEAHAAALRRFQWRHLLTVDGRLGPATWRELATPLAQRLRTIELTLERWRWVPPHLHEAPIVVNIPEFRLFAWETPQDEEDRLLKLEVIVGEPYLDKNTPVFEGRLRYLVFRPWWDVPHGIAVRELLPKIRADRHFLAAQRLEIVRGRGNDAQPLEATAANLAAVARGRLRLRQRPGPDNALGLVKFMLPNPYNVYLHSTPAQSLFERPTRAFSHGCVRVQDAGRLAAFLLRDDPAWSEEKIAAAMAEGAADSRIVKLAHPVPVYFVYATAMASRDGLRFFPDVYGHDARLDRLIRQRSHRLQLPQ